MPPGGDSAYFTHDDLIRPRGDQIGPFRTKTEVNTHGDTAGAEDASQAPHVIQEADEVKGYFTGTPGATTVRDTLK